MLCLIRKIQCVRQIARLKQQLSLSFTFYKTQRSYEKIICICYFIGSVVKIVLSEAATRGARYKKVFLKLQKSQENTSATVSFLINLQVLRHLYL